MAYYTGSGIFIRGDTGIFLKDISDKILKHLKEMKQTWQNLENCMRWWVFKNGLYLSFHFL